MDADGLRRGEKYGKLAKSFIIFICMDDPYNKGLSKYTIEPTCKEIDIPVKSGMQWIVLNASGDGNGVTKEVQEFLAYAKDSCPENAANAFLREIGSAMESILTGEWRDAMITYEEKMQWMREDLLEEGREKGRAEGRAEALKEALQASQKTARNLHDRGMSVEDIANAMTINADIVQDWINGEA